MFARTNVLLRRFRMCSVEVKVVLFKSFVYACMILEYGKFIIRAH